jgi:hypothetical protein
MGERDDNSWTDGAPATSREIEALLAELDVEDLTPAPVPASVWDGIEAGLDGPAVGTPTAEQQEADAVDVVDITRRRRGLGWWVAGAAAAAVVLVVSVGVAITGGDDDIDVRSTAQLGFDPDNFDPLGADAAATAELVSVDGELQIRLTDAQLPELDGADLELWLIEPDADGTPVDVAPVSTLDGSDVYTLPAGLDPTSHFVVDISIEPRDGDEAHSGRSILRGSFTEA